MNKFKNFVFVAGLLTVLSIVLIPGCIPEVADIDPPFIQILYPSAGSTVNGTIPVVVAASDDDKVKEVRIYIDGIVELTTASNFATYTWDTTPIADNLTHYISAVAIDESDNIGYSPVTPVIVARGQNPDITPPVVSILHPVPNQVVNGTVNIVAEARDDNEVDRVEFYIDGHLEETVSARPFDYLWDTAQVDSGLHAIFLRAYDTNNNSSASNTITVVVIPDTSADTTPPVVSILHPVGGQVVSGQVNIVAEAWDDTQVDRVEFYVDGHLEETVSTRPFDYLWDTTLLPDSSQHTIFLRAYDTSNNSSASNTITVTVIQGTSTHKQRPVVKILSPNRNRSLFSESDISAVPIEIKAQDDTAIGRVELYVDGSLKEVFTDNAGKAENVIRYEWNLEGYGDGLLHSLFVKAFDGANNVGTDMILVRINP